MNCIDCALFQTGACEDYSTTENDTACDRFLSNEVFEEYEKQQGEQG